MNKNIVKKDMTRTFIDTEDITLLMRTTFDMGTKYTALVFFLDGRIDIIGRNAKLTSGVYLCFEI